MQVGGLRHRNNLLGEKGLRFYIKRKRVLKNCSRSLDCRDFSTFSEISEIKVDISINKGYTSNNE
jgi:hypothetical protein